MGEQTTNMLILVEGACEQGERVPPRNSTQKTRFAIEITPTFWIRRDVVITDGNAAGDYTKFAPAPGGLRIVNKELTFAEYWTDDDVIQGYRRKSAKCAEVLPRARMVKRIG